MNLINSFSSLGKSLITQISSIISYTSRTLLGTIDGKVDSENTGWSVSLNDAGDRIAIGAPSNNGSTGAVRIYSWDGSIWTQLGTDIYGEASSDISGYSISMNAAGDRVAIGAYQNDGTSGSASNNQGHVRVYSWDGASWIQLGADIDGQTFATLFGWSVSINAVGDRVAIGGPYNNSNRGVVRIYSWNGSTWIQLGTDINGKVANDYCGWSVSLNDAGDRVAIGNVWNNAFDFSTGYVTIYSWDGTNWTQMGTDILAEFANENFGNSVSMNAAGDRVVIGAPSNNGSSGAVRIYSWDGTAWIKLGNSIIGQSLSRFGWSVSINNTGNIIAAGGPLKGATGVSNGHIKIYSWINDQWTQLLPSILFNGDVVQDQFGRSVSINSVGDIIAIGAPYHDTNGSNSGRVKIYKLT